ncbi:MAG: peptidylprolyl isomerase [Acidobacteria bacterium]|nr:peptidylprolyl isomerase [Acidobacteriota bacterium]
MPRLYLLPVSLCALSAMAADTAISTVEEIIAKVNGDIVTRTELSRTRKQAEEEYRRQGLTGAKLTAAMQERESSVLRDRIDQLLLVQKAKDLSINVESEISKQLAEIQKQLKIADPDKFQSAVKEQLGMPFEDYKNEMRNSMLTERVIRQEVGATINIPKSEVQKYYEEHKTEFVREERVFLGEIFLSTAGKDAAAVAAIEKKAKDLVARARKGERFPEMARDNSDSQTAQNGGDLGGWKRADLSAEIANLVFEKDRNFVTDPIQRPDGFLILKVMEKHTAGQAALEDVESEIMNRLYGPRFQPKIREYLTKLREQAFLEIKPGFVDSGSAPGKDTSWKDPAQLKPETVTKEEVANIKRRKRMFWAVPMPGTNANEAAQEAVSSSKAVKK